MPRPSRFDQDAILNAALEIVVGAGPTKLTTETVAARMGGHIGSIYYRFPTKDHLLAALWLRSARAGQAGLLKSLQLEDRECALEEAVLHYPRWARIETATAQILAGLGREQVSPRWPSELDNDLQTVNDDLIRALDAFTVRWYGDSAKAHRRVVTFAVLDLPSGAIRRYLLAGKPPPRHLDAPVLLAAKAALAAGRSTSPVT